MHVKDKTPRDKQCYTVYGLKCSDAGCDESLYYVGETKQFIKARFNQHRRGSSNKIRTLSCLPLQTLRSPIQHWGLYHSWQNRKVICERGKLGYVSSSHHSTRKLASIPTCLGPDTEATSSSHFTFIYYRSTILCTVWKPSDWVATSLKVA